MEELLLSVVIKKPFVNSSEAAGDKLEFEDFLGVVGWAGDGGLPVAVQGTVGVVVKSGFPSDGKVRVISDRETEDSLETTCSDLIDIVGADEGEGGWVPVSDSSFTEHSGTDELVAQLSCFDISGDPDFTQGNVSERVEQANEVSWKVGSGISTTTEASALGD